MWGSLASAAASMAAAEYQKAAYQRSVQSQRGFNALAVMPAAAAAKCPCCGSRQFKQHNAVRVCTYCRSEQ